MRSTKYREAALDLILLLGGSVGAWQAYGIENEIVSIAVIAALATTACIGAGLLFSHLFMRH